MDRQIKVKEEGIIEVSMHYGAMVLARALRLRRRQVAGTARTGGRAWRARGVFSNKRLGGPICDLTRF